MGGYGALRFGSLLRATRALSFVPQYSIDPNDVGNFDTRYKQHFRANLNTQSAIRPGDPPPVSYIFFDPFTIEDRLNVDKILRAGGDARLVKSWLTGHRTVETFASTELTASLINSCLAGDTAKIQRAATYNRRVVKPGIRPAEIAAQNISKNLTLATRFMSTYATIIGEEHLSYLHHGIAGDLSKKKQWNLAAHHAARATALNLKVPDFFMRYSTIELQRGKRDNARAQAEKAVALSPVSLFANLNLFEILLNTDQMVRAVEQVSFITAKFSDDPLQPARLADSAVRARRVDLADDILSRAFVDFPSSLAVGERLCRVYISMPRWGKAGDVADRLISLVPDNLEYYELSSLAWRRYGDAGKSRARVMRLLELDPSNKLGRDLARELGIQIENASPSFWHKLHVKLSFLRR